MCNTNTQEEPIQRWMSHRNIKEGPSYDATSTWQWRGRTLRRPSSAAIYVPQPSRRDDKRKETLVCYAMIKSCLIASFSRVARGSSNHFECFSERSENGEEASPSPVLDPPRDRRPSLPPLPSLFLLCSGSISY